MNKPGTGDRAARQYGNVARVPSARVSTTPTTRLVTPSTSPPEVTVSEEVQRHAQRKKLAALCFDVVSFQAEARNLSFSRRALRQRKSYRSLSKTDADTVYGNVLAILERGPDRLNDWALLSGFFVLGLENTFAEASAAERRELLERFARHSDFLEGFTPYAPYRFASDILSASTRVALVEVLETGLLAAQDGPSAPAFRARAMLRIQVLAALKQKEARLVLIRVAESSSDPAVQAAAREALGEAPLSPSEGVELRGVVGRMPRFSVLRVLSHLIGLTLIVAVIRSFAYLVGYENEARVRLEQSALYVHRETRLFGRTLRVRDTSYTLSHIDCATREVGAPALPLLLGAASLALGTVFGTIWLSDGLARNDANLMLSAVLAFVAGVSIDMFFSGWAKLRGQRAGFEMDVDKRCVLALRRVEAEPAQRLVEQIARRRS